LQIENFILVHQRSKLFKLTFKFHYPAMPLFRQTILLLSLITCFSGLYSQTSFRKGKIITDSNDTISGLIDTRVESKLYRECRFKQSDNAQMVTYSPKTIKAFIIDDNMRKFVRGSHPLVTDYVFFEVLCEGKINLYYSNETKSPNYFVQKKGENAAHCLTYEQHERYVDNGYTRYLKTIETTYHIDTLKMLMSDAPSLYTDIEKIQTPGRSNLIKIVNKYNSGLVPNNSQKNALKKSSSTDLKLLRSGKINLYMQTDSASEEHFSIQKGEGTKLIELPFLRMENTHINGLVIKSYTNLTTLHKDTLRKYMADATPLFSTIEDIKKPTKTNLINLIDEYNSYTDEATYNRKHTLKRLPLNIDVIPGLSLTLAYVRYSNVKFGGIVDIGFSNSNKHYFLKTGFFYSKGDSPLTDLYYTLPKLVDYTGPVSTFKIPLQFEYRLSEKMFQPCLAIGYNFYSFKEDKPYEKLLLPVLAPGINIQMGKRCSIRLNVELEFKNENQMSYTPKSFDKASMFIGCQVKL
jgi:hypothetical protein